MSIKFENVSYIYDRKTPFEKEALLNVSFEIKEGESLSILGKTGSGKSTILQLMNGIIKPTTGKVEVDGMLTSDKNLLFEIRKRIGLVFQYPEHQFFADTVYEEVAFGPRNFGMDEKAVDAAIRESIKTVGLELNVISKSPFALSGGEKRKVAIASVIACGPKYLVFDEPTSSLDPTSAETFFKMLQDFRLRGKSTIIVTHSVEEAISHFERAIIISNGKLVFDGRSEDILKQNLIEFGLLPPPMERIYEMVKKECGDIHHLKEIIHKSDFKSV